MLYIERDEEGRISSIHHNPTEKTTEQKTLLDEEIIAFLSKDKELNSWIQLLSLSDLSIIRIIEDLVDILVNKNVIMFTELPEEARNKLKERKRVREKMGDDPFIVNDII